MKPEWIEERHSSPRREIRTNIAEGSVAVHEELGGSWVSATVTKSLRCDVDAAKDQAFGILLPKLEAMVADMRRMMADAQSPEVVAETEAGGKL